MKLLLIITIFLSNLLFADSNYNKNYSGKIDMHGGKSENLLNDKNSLSNKDFKNIGINKQTAPIQPKEPSNLIKDEKKDKKEIRK